MGRIKFLSGKKIEELSALEREAYFKELRDTSLSLHIKKESEIARRALVAICPMLNGIEVELRGVENVPENDSAIFVCNHSNAHDMYTTQETFHRLGRVVSPFAGSDCLSPFAKTAFSLLNATFVDRLDKESGKTATCELINRVLNGQDIYICPESTWNIHPQKPMHDIKLGPANIGAASGKLIIPMNYEYVEVPGIVEKESEIFESVIVTFGKPIKIDPRLSMIDQTVVIQKALTTIRLNTWHELGIDKTHLGDRDIEVYLNHTYYKKFGAFAFEYDSAYEAQFLYSSDSMPAENEYHLDSQGRFVPGVTLKRKKY